MSIHRRLGVMTDADDVRTAWCYRIVTDDPEEFDDVSEVSAAEEEEFIVDHDKEAPSPTEETITALYNRYASNVPAHIQSLLTETPKQIDEEPDEERKVITLLFIAYQDLFVVDETDIGKTDVITHDVDTWGCKPICQAM